MTRRSWIFLPGSVAAALLLAACGGGGDTTVSSAQSTESTESTGAEAGAGSTAAGSATKGAGAQSAPAADAAAAAAPAAQTPVAEASGAAADAPSTPATGSDAGSVPATASSTTADELASRPDTAGSAQSPAAKAAAKPAAAKATVDRPAVARAAAAAPKVSAADRAAYDKANGATDIGVTRDSIKLGSVNMHGMALGNLVTAPVVRGNLASITAINDRGGVLGRRLSIVDCDDGPGEVARAKACIKKLVDNDKIFSLIGGVDWATASIHDDLKQNGLPYVGAWAYSQTEWQDPYMFPTHMSMIHEAMAGANWVKNVIKPKTYALLCLNSPEMQVACNQVQKILDASGSKNAKRIDVAISEPTMSPQIVSLRAAAPDHIIHYVINPATMAKFMIEAEQQNYYPPMGISGNHLAAEALGSLFGQHAAGRYWTNTTYKLWGAEFIATMTKYARGNKGLNHHNVQSAYVGVNFLAQAAKQVGPNLTRDRLMDQLANGDVWRADASLDQKFSYAPSERFGEKWRSDLGQNREFMYKMNTVNTASNPDGSPSGWAPDPDQFVIHAR